MSIDKYLLQLEDFKEEKEIKSTDQYRLYIAVSLENTKKYVIKQFYFHKAATIETFQSVITQYSTLKNETIVPFIGFCSIEQTETPVYSIITKYMEGSSLENLFELVHQGNLPPFWNPTRNIIYLYGIIFGLNYLHQNNIIHQNLNLSNILLDEQGFPKISDFQISSLIPINTNDYPKSKLIFLAPEVIGTNRYSFQSDIYSFGILSIMLLSSDVNILEADISTHDLIDKIKHGILSVLPENVPKFMHKLILRCISIDPSKRPPASEILEKITEFIPEFVTHLKIDKEEFDNYKDLLTGAEESFEEKVQEAKAAADSGDAQAMLQYARFRQFGDGCKKNKQEAIEYFKKAALNGHPEAPGYLRNLGVVFDPSEKPIAEAKIAYKGKVLKTNFREKLRALNEARLQMNVVSEERKIRMLRNADEMKLRSSETLGIEYRRLADDPFFDKTQAPDMDQIIEQVENELDNPNYKLTTDFDEVKAEIAKTFNFIFTEGAEERLCKLRDYMKCGVPVLLEGPTGTSKTLSVEIICKLLNKEIIRFNLSSETKTKDLVGRFVGDVNSWAGLRQKDGPFHTAFKEGKVLLLDEINLASPSVLQCIEEALDSGVFSVEIPGRSLDPIYRHPDFVLVATQNPNKGAFANKRQDLGLKFSSHFQIITFPAFTETELQTIAEGLAQRFGYDNKEVISELVQFHSAWSRTPAIQNDPQCFTIREIAAAVHAFSQKRNVYDTVMTIYGARYEADLKNQLTELLIKYKHLAVRPDSTPIPHFGDYLFPNISLSSAIKSILFSLESGRHVILTGKEGCGKTQVALWISDYYNKTLIPLIGSGDSTPPPSDPADIPDTSDEFYCICTEDTKVADLVGKQSPASTAKAGDELIVFEQGFLTKAIKRGKCAVLESIDEAPATVTERLNGLLDQKYDNEDKYFDIPEDPKNPKVLIKNTFRILSTCNIEKIGLISPAFLNRFDIIVLESQLPVHKSNEFKRLVQILIDKHLNDLKERASKTSTPDLSLFAIPKTLRENATSRLESHTWNTISKISTACKALATYYLFFPKSEELTEELILDFTLNMMSSFIVDNNTKGNNLIAPLHTKVDEKEIDIDYSPIINYLLSQLKNVNANPNYKDDKFFYENSPLLKYFMAKLMAYSLINQPVCVSGPTGVGKTSSARAFASMRPNSQGEHSSFKMHSFHAGTKTSQFFGTTILTNGKIDFHDGTLTTALKKGEAFIADEFNLSPQLVMKSIAPALEQTLDRKIFIPGIGQAINIADGFFFIACQNDLGTLGRNAIPESIAHKFAYIPYPRPSLKDMQDICVSISHEGYEDLSFYPHQDEAEKLAVYMNRLNTESLRNPYVIPWSLRDIAKIFRRIRYQNLPENRGVFNQIDIPLNVFFYTMASIPQSYQAIGKETIELIKKAFQESFDIPEDRMNEIYETYTSKPHLVFVDGNYYIQKKNSTILVNSIYNNLTINSPNDNLNSTKEIYSKLRSLWDTAFQILLCDCKEPILLVGESGYKTFLSQLFIRDASIITLNQEISVAQLLGSTAFFSTSEAKMFYLKTLCEICDAQAEYHNLLASWTKGELTREVIDEIAERGKRECPTSFFYAIDQFKEKLFAPPRNEESVLSNTTLEFRPGLFLSAILQRKSLILKDLSNLPTIVLERFNELFSGKQNITLTEDIHNTFTDGIHKELTDFANSSMVPGGVSSFRVFATSPANSTSKLSEAVLSRFTVITTPKYNTKESICVLRSLCATSNLNISYTTDNSSIQKLMEIANSYLEKTKEAGNPKDISFPLMIKIIQIASKLNDLANENGESFNLAMSIFRIVGGYENDESKKLLYDAIVEKIGDSNFPDITKIIETPDNLLNDRQMVPNAEQSPLHLETADNHIGIKSSFSKLFIQSATALQSESLEIAFTPLFFDLVDVIHFSMKLYAPLILDGPPGQGKHTAINYFATMIGWNVISISISPATKVDDLLGKVKIERQEGEIRVHMIKTNLANALDAGAPTNDLRDNTIFVIESINNATPAVLSLLVSIFKEDINSILLPNGETINKAPNVHIIGLFDTSDGSTTRDKLPPALYYSSVYHTVRNPNDPEIAAIINKTFQANDLLLESVEFHKRFHGACQILLNYPHIGSIFSLNDISKYILFRQATRTLLPNPITISHIIFVYRFFQEDLIAEMRNLITETSTDSSRIITLRPSFNYDTSYTKFFIQVSPDAKDQGLAIPLLDVSEKKNDSYIEALSRIDSLTSAQKYCLIFLACSLLSKRACVIQGDTASGKSFMVRLFADLLGAKLNVFQMNSDSSLSMLAGQSVLSDTLSSEDEDKFQEILDKFAAINELHKYIYYEKREDFEDRKKWSPKLFTDLIHKVEKTQIPGSKTEMIYTSLKQLKEIMNPVHRFKQQESQFIKAMQNGEWVLIDGIESAPSEIAVKLTSLCGENPELNLFEYGPDYMFSKKSETNKIHDQFHLFITFNPNAIKDGQTFDQSFLAKCVSFTLEEIDGKIDNSAQILLGGLLSQSYEMDTAMELATRLGNLHTEAKLESRNNPMHFAGELQFTGRTLKFITKAFRLHMSQSDSDCGVNIVTPIAFSLRNFYLNSISDEGNLTEFKKNLIQFLKLEKKHQDDGTTQGDLKQQLLLSVNNSNQKHRNQAILTNLRYIQLYVLDREQSTISLPNFLQQCQAIQISDISFILKHVEETIDLIHQNNEEGQKTFMSKFGFLFAIRDIFRQISRVNLSIEHSCLQLCDPDLRNDADLIKPLSQLLLLGSLMKGRSHNFSPRKSMRRTSINLNQSCSSIPAFPYYSSQSSFLLDSIVRTQLIEYIARVVEIRECASVFELVQYTIRHPSDAEFVDSVFPYNSFQDTDLKSLCFIIRLLMKCIARGIYFNIAYKLSNDDHSLTCEYIPNANETELQIYIYFDENSKFNIAPDSYFLYSKKNKKVIFKDFPVPFERTHYFFSILYYILNPEYFSPPIHFTKHQMEPILNHYLSIIKVTKSQSGYIDNDMDHVLPDDFMEYTSFTDFFDDSSEDLEPIAYCWNLVTTLSEDQIRNVSIILNPLLSDMLLSLRANYVNCDFSLIASVTTFTGWLIEFFKQIQVLFKIKASFNIIPNNDPDTLDKAIQAIRSEIAFFSTLEVKVLEWDINQYISDLSTNEEIVNSKYEKEMQEKKLNEKKLNELIEDINKMVIGGNNENLKKDLITEIRALPHTHESVIYATRKAQSLERAYQKLSFDIHNNIIDWPTISKVQPTPSFEFKVMAVLYEYSTVYSILRTREEVERNKYENPHYKESEYEQIRMNTLVKLNLHQYMDGAIESLFKKKKKKYINDAKTEEKKEQRLEHEYHEFQKRMNDAYHELNAHFLYQLMEIDQQTKQESRSRKDESGADDHADQKNRKSNSYTRYFQEFWKVIDLFNDRISRNPLNDSEIYRFFELTKTTPETFEFIVPNITPRDFLYLYVKKYGTKKGPISKTASPNPNLAHQLEEALKSRFHTFSQVATKIAHEVVRCTGLQDFDLTNLKDIKKYILRQYNDLIEQEKKELQSMNPNTSVNSGNFKTTVIFRYIESIKDILSAAKKYDEYYHSENYSQLGFRFDDLEFLTHSHWLGDQPFLTQLGRQYPSFLFWICKNHQIAACIRRNFKSFYEKLRNAPIDGNEAPQFRLPFWVHCLREFSAQNCIQFDSPLATANFSIINHALRTKILEAIRFDQRTTNMLGIRWINVMLPELPHAIADSKLHIVHNFLKNLCMDDSASQCLFVANENIKEKAIHTAIEQIFQYVLDEKIDEVFNDNIDRADVTSLVHFFDNPEHYVYSAMSQALDDQFFAFKSKKEVNELKASFLPIFEDATKLSSAINKDKDIILEHKRSQDQYNTQNLISNSCSYNNYYKSEYQRIFSYLSKLNLQTLNDVKKNAKDGPSIAHYIYSLQNYREKLEIINYPFKTGKPITFHYLQYRYLGQTLYLNCNKKPITIKPLLNYRSTMSIILPLELTVPSFEQLSFFCDDRFTLKAREVQSAGLFNTTLQYFSYTFYPLDNSADLLKLTEKYVLDTKAASSNHSISINFYAGMQLSDTELIREIQELIKGGQNFEKDFIGPIDHGKIQDSYTYLQQMKIYASHVFNISMVNTTAGNYILSHIQLIINKIRPQYKNILHYLNEVEQLLQPLYDNSQKFKSVANRTTTDLNTAGFTSVFKHSYTIQRPQIAPQLYLPPNGYFQISDGNSLALPVLSQLENNELRSSVNSIDFSIGPIIPSLYSQKAMISILSMVNQPIESSLFVDDKKDCFLITSAVDSKMPIRISVSIPLTRKEKVENLLIKGSIEFSTDPFHKISLPIQTRFILIPLQIKIACEQYKLYYYDSKFRICCDRIFSNDHITIKILNYFHSKSLKLMYNYTIQPEDDNEAPEPIITIDNDTRNLLTIRMDEVHINQPKRLHCNLRIAFARNLSALLSLDTEIYPFLSFFQVYDYLKRSYLYDSTTIVCQKRSELTIYFRVMFPCLPRSVYGRFFYKLPSGVEIINVAGLNGQLINLERINMLNSRKQLNRSDLTYNNSTLTLEENNELETMEKCVVEITQNFTFSVTLRFAQDFIPPSQSNQDPYRFSVKIGLEPKALFSPKVFHFSIKTNFMIPPPFLLNFPYSLSIAQFYKDNNIPVYVFDHACNQFVLYRYDREIKSFSINSKPIVYATPFQSESLDLKVNAISYSNSDVFVSKPANCTPFFFKLCTNGLVLPQAPTSDSTKYANPCKEQSSVIGNVINTVGAFFEQPTNNYYYTICGSVNQDTSIWFPAFSKYPTIPPILQLRPENVSYAHNNINRALKELLSLEKLPPDLPISLGQLATNVFPLPHNNFALFIIMMLDDKIFGKVNSFVQCLPSQLSNSSIKSYIPHISASPDLMIIYKHNFIFHLASIFYKRYRDLRDSRFSLTPTFDLNKLRSQQSSARNSLFYYTSNFNNYIYPDTRSPLYNTTQIVSKIKASSAISPLPSPNLLHEGYMLVQDAPPQPTKFHAKQNKVDEDLTADKAIAADSSNISDWGIEQLPSIEIPPTPSISSLLEFYNKCAQGASILPIYFRTKQHNDKELTDTIRYFYTLYEIFRSLATLQRDYSVISESVNDFVSAFKETVYRMKKSGMNLTTIIDDNILKIVETENLTSEFLKMPEPDLPSLQKYRWIIKEMTNQSNPDNNRKALDAMEGIGVDTDDDAPQSQVQVQMMEDSSDPEDLNDSTHDEEEDRVIPLGEIQFVKVARPDDEPVTDQTTDEAQPNEPTFQVADPRELKNFQSSGKSLDEIVSNMDKKEEIDRIIRKIKDCKPGDELKLKSVDSLIEYTIEQYPFGRPLGKPFESPSKTPLPIINFINLSSQLITRIVGKIADQVSCCPLDFLTVDLIIDASHFIPVANKLFNIVLLCGFAYAFDSLEVPYSITIAADKEFRFILKTYEDQDPQNALQACLDCIFIKRYRANYADIFHFIHEKVKKPDPSRTQRAMFIFTDGLDENLALVQSWRKKIFAKNRNYSYGIIATVPKLLAGKSRETMNRIWNEFNGANSLGLILCLESNFGNPKIYTNIAEFATRIVSRKNLDSLLINSKDLQKVNAETVFIEPSDIEREGKNSVSTPDEGDTQAAIPRDPPLTASSDKGLGMLSGPNQQYSDSEQLEYDHEPHPNDDKRGTPEALAIFPSRCNTMDDSDLEFITSHTKETLKIKNISTIFVHIEKQSSQDRSTQKDIPQLISTNYRGKTCKMIQCQIADSTLKSFILWLHEFTSKVKAFARPQLEPIFKANKPSQMVLSTTGIDFDITALVLNLLNPVPNPAIYLEEKGGLIRNYAVTIVIDTSNSCFNFISSSHSIFIIFTILAALSSIDIPSVDVILARQEEPLVLCSERPSQLALGEKSQLWPALIHYLNHQDKNSGSNLEAAIRTAIDLRRMRSSDYTAYLFVLTDGIYQAHRAEAIKKLVDACFYVGINTIGIGIGISATNITNLFSQAVYVYNPDLIIHAIACCFGDENVNPMKKIFPLIAPPISEDRLIEFAHKEQDFRESPIFPDLKNILEGKPASLDAFADVYNEEQKAIIKGTYELANIENIQNPAGDNSQMFVENLLKGQKILVLMLYNCTFNIKESEKILKDYLFTPPQGSNSCVNDAVKYFGIELVVVESYREAINELTKPDPEKTDYCQYYAVWVISGFKYRKVPVKGDEINVLRFIKLLIDYWMKGGSVVLFAESYPLTFQANMFLEMVQFPDKDGKYFNTKLRLGGNHLGGKDLLGYPPPLKIDQTFVRDRIEFNCSERVALSHNLYRVYEGETISYAIKIDDNGEPIYDNDHNPLVADEEKDYSPFKPFMKNSSGGISGFYYAGDRAKDLGDIIVDCGFTKLFDKMTEDVPSTEKYIQNIAGFTAHPEYSILRNIDPKDYRPHLPTNTYSDKTFDFTDFDEHQNLDGSIDEPDYESKPKLFAVDYSGSVKNDHLYHSTLEQIFMNIHNYNSSKDLIVLWDSKAEYADLDQMIDIWKNERGRSATCPQEIIRLLLQYPPRDSIPTYFILITDGFIYPDDIIETGRVFQESNISFDYVATYIIGSGDLSVGCSFVRNCPSVVYKVDSSGIHTVRKITKLDLELFDNLANIETPAAFHARFENIFKATRAKCMGTKEQPQLRDTLIKVRNNLQQYEGDPLLPKCLQRLDLLIDLASGEIADIFDDASITAMAD